MLGSRIKLDKELLERCRQHAKKAGYSSVEEFISHAVELELRKHDRGQKAGDKQILDRLKGLGYIE